MAAHIAYTRLGDSRFGDRLPSSASRAANEAPDAAIAAALDEERAKSRKHLKELEFKHSNAMMSLLEATKGAVEHDLTVKVMEADGAIDENCKNAVDDMLFGFLSGCEAVTNDLNKNMDLFMEEEKALKKKEERKSLVQIKLKKH